MRRIKLHAFFGTNLGDDLMVDILLNRYPQYQFYSDTADTNSNMFLSYPNFENRTAVCKKYGRLNYVLNVLSRKKSEDFLLHKIFSRREKSSCCGVLIGGSMFMQLKAAPDKQLGWEEARFGKLPRYVIGVNFGPYQTESFREAFDGYFRRCRGVTFRDRHSYRLFSHNGNAEYAPDVVLNLNIDPYKQPCDGTVLISVIYVRQREHLKQWADDYEQLILKLCETCIQQGKKPVLMSFCKQEGDEEAIQQIVDQMPKKIKEETGVFHYNGNLKEALEMFAKAEYVVATRFHAMILALRFHKPFFSIAYSEKVKWVLDDLKCQSYCGMDQLRGQDPVEILNTNDTEINVDTYIQEAIHQFDQLDIFLKQRGK